MNTTDQWTRRGFLTRAFGAAIAAAHVSGLPRAQEPARRAFKIGGFTKPFQQFGFAETADFAADIGWDGVEVPVRKGGQILPERVEDDLPRLVEALKRRGLTVFTIATDVRDLRDPLSERVIRTAAKVGVPVYRLAHIHYGAGRSIPRQLDAIRSGFAELADLNRELGIDACYENHSGADSVGASIWDIYELFKEFDARDFGVCFDIGHATIEGGMAWGSDLRLMGPFLRAVYVKDFVWRKRGDEWNADWCPLGAGMVNPKFISDLRRLDFSGPIIQHHEYALGDSKEMRIAMRADCETLKVWLASR